MGRALQGGRVRRLTGDKRRAMVAQWARQGRRCYYCRHGFTAPGLIEVAHVISWVIRADLAEDPANLAPAHGGGASRCPECDLACNQVSHQAPDSPRDHSTGASLPFTEQFMARQIELRRKFRANPRNSKRAPDKVPESPEKPWSAQFGRDW